MGPALPLYLSDNGDICIESGGKICSKFVQFVEMSTKSMDNQFVHDFEDQIVNFHWIQCYKEKRKLGLGHFFRCGRGEHFFFFILMLPSFTTGFLFFVSFLPGFAQTLIEGLDIILLPAVITIALWIVRSSCFPE